MMNTTLAGPQFREGDEVILAAGSYQGTPGVFVRFHDDLKWADIAEHNGQTRCHPVEWLAHPTRAGTNTQAIIT